MADINEERPEIGEGEAGQEAEKGLVVRYAQDVIARIMEQRGAARVTLARTTNNEAKRELADLYRYLSQPRTSGHLERAVDKNLGNLLEAEILAGRIRQAAGRLEETIIERIGEVVAIREGNLVLDAKGVEALSETALHAAGNLTRHVGIENSQGRKFLTEPTTKLVSVADIRGAMTRPIRHPADVEDIARHIERYITELVAIVTTKIKAHTAIAAEKMRMLGEIVRGIAEDLVLFERSGRNPKMFDKIEGAIQRLLATLDTLMIQVESNAGEAKIFLKDINPGILLKELLREQRETERRRLKEGGEETSPEVLRRIQLLRDHGKLLKS